MDLLSVKGSRDEERLNKNVIGRRTRDAAEFERLSTLLLISCKNS